MNPGEHNRVLGFIRVDFQGAREPVHCGLVLLEEALVLGLTLRRQKNNVRRKHGASEVGLGVAKDLVGGWEHYSGDRGAVCKEQTG